MSREIIWPHDAIEMWRSDDTHNHMRLVVSGLIPSIYGNRIQYDGSFNGTVEGIGDYGPTQHEILDEGEADQIRAKIEAAQKALAERANT